MIEGAEFVNVPSRWFVDGVAVWQVAQVPVAVPSPTASQVPSWALPVVVGVPDETFGSRVALLITLEPGVGKAPSLTELRQWGREYLAKYKLPTLLKVVDAIPRNAMHKVNKKVEGTFKNRQFYFVIFLLKFHYSTVTLFAKFLGLSTFLFLSTAE